MLVLILIVGGYKLFNFLINIIIECVITNKEDGINDVVCMSDNK